MDKLSVLYTVLAAVFTLLLALRQMKVSSVKDLEDDGFKEGLNRDIKDIKLKTDKVNFNTASARFFQENDFSKYEKFFVYGFTVYHHSSEFDKPFKKSYGSNIYVEYVEYSENAIFKQVDTDRDNLYTLRLKIKFKKVAGERNFSNLNMSYNVLVDSYNVGKVQRLYGIGEYGKPHYNFCDYFILLNHEKPYTYAIGPQDCDFFKGR